MSTQLMTNPSRKDQTLGIATQEERESTQRGLGGRPENRVCRRRKRIRRIRPLAAKRSQNPLYEKYPFGPRRFDDVHLSPNLMAPNGSIRRHDRRATFRKRVNCAKSMACREGFACSLRSLVESASAETLTEVRVLRRLCA